MLRGVEECRSKIGPRALSFLLVSALGLVEGAQSSRGLIRRDLGSGDGVFERCKAPLFDCLG